MYKFQNKQQSIQPKDFTHKRRINRDVFLRHSSRIERKNNLLVFDEDSVIREKYKRELRAEGYNVFTAGNIKDALNTVNLFPIDLVIMDLDFSNGSGLDHLYDIMNEDRSLKVLINSGRPEYKYDFHTWTADAFLAKSAGIPELKHQIRILLQKDEERTFVFNKFN